MGGTWNWHVTSSFPSFCLSQCRLESKAELNDFVKTKGESLQTKLYVIASLTQTDDDSDSSILFDCKSFNVSRLTFLHCPFVPLHKGTSSILLFRCCRRCKQKKDDEYRRQMRTIFSSLCCQTNQEKWNINSLQTLTSIAGGFKLRFRS